MSRSSRRTSWLSAHRSAVALLVIPIVIAAMATGILAGSPGLTAPPAPAPSASPLASSVTLAATDDAFTAADQPATPHNGAWVWMDARPQQYGYFRFDVAVPAGSRVASAVFRCYPGGASSPGASLWALAGYDWSETTLTWSNATVPAFTLPAVGSTGRVRAGAYASANVTSAVTASGSYTFVTRTTSKTAWACESKENAAGHPPLLVLTYTSVSPSPTGPPSPPPPSTTPPTTPPTTTPPTTAPPTTAPPTPPTEATIVDAIGDGGPDAAHWNSPLAARLIADQPALMLWTGDVRDNGTPAEWALYDQVYGALKSVTLPTPGNHDWANASIGYDVEFATDPYADTATYCNGVTLPNGWGVFSINTYTQTSCLPKLTEFLSAPGTRKIVVTHEPRWSGGTHGPDAGQDAIWSAMKGHAFALVSGHDHDSQVIEADGMVQLVSGCGGADFYAVTPSKVTSPASLVYYATSVSDCTFDRLLLSANTVTVEAVHADGSIDFRRTYPVPTP